MASWLGALAIRPERRTAERPCRHCRYDLTGLASDQNCPECGEPYAIWKPPSALSLLAELAVWWLVASVVFAPANSPANSPAMFTFALVLLVVVLTGTTVIAVNARFACRIVLHMGALVPAGLVSWWIGGAGGANLDPGDVVLLAVAALYVLAASGFGVLAASIVCTWQRIW
jgi:hypothetical protein